MSQQAASQRTTVLLGRVDSATNNLVNEFRQIISLNTNSGKDRSSAASEIYEIETRTVSLITAAEELMFVTRSLRESWILGQVKPINKDIIDGDVDMNYTNDCNSAQMSDDLLEAIMDKTLDDPHRVWTPKSVIQGNVVLVLFQNQPAFLLECRLEGSITIKNPLVKGKSSKYRLFEDTIILWSSEERYDSQDNQTSTDNNIDLQANGSEIDPDEQRSNGSSTIAPVTSSINSTSSSNEQVTLETRDRLGSSESSTSLSSSSSSSSVHTTSHSLVPKILPRGEHNFPFAFELPETGLYNSLEFERGSISYVITAIYHKPGPAPTISCKKNISIICPLNVASLLPPAPSIFSVEVRKRKQESGVITSMIEMPSRGYLRGESIPVTITIKHVRPVRSLFGVVVTLSRISRVRYGGLEHQSFRKDLSQTVAPLYTDPTNFSAIISNRIRIPPESFPTTTGHKMVSFQYCIEAVIDLAGKWNLNMSDEESSSRLGLLDTDKLKKHRGVVSLWMEVVIGTERWTEQVPTKASLSPADRDCSSTDPEILNSNESSIPVQLSDNGFPLAENIQNEDVLRDGNIQNYIQNQSEDSVPYDEGVFHSSAPEYNNLGSRELNNANFEKEQLRLREQALLPSQPPILPQDSNFTEPSAPPLRKDDITNETTAKSGSDIKADRLEEELRRLQLQQSEPETYQNQLPPSAPSLDEDTQGGIRDVLYDHNEDQTSNTRVLYNVPKYETMQ